MAVPKQLRAHAFNKDSEKSKRVGAKGGKRSPGEGQHADSTSADSKTEGKSGTGRKPKRYHRTRRSKS